MQRGVGGVRGCFEGVLAMTLKLLTAVAVSCYIENAIVDYFNQQRAV